MRALTQLKLAGTKSFRLSASQFFGYGINAQNSDKSLLDIFEAPPGWKIVSVDQAGAEALIVAYLCRPGNYRELFTEGVKPHIYVALHIFLDKFRGDNSPARYWLTKPGVLKTYPEWAALSKTISSSPFEYDLGKKTGHASNYRMRENTFREQALKESGGTLNLSMEQAAHFLNTYKVIFPEIVEWQSEIEESVRSGRQLRNLLGFPRQFNQLITDGYIREAISWVPQSTVGCITHVAYKMLTDHIRREGLRWRPFNNKHDSYAALVPDAEVREAATMMTKFINMPLVGRDGAQFVMASEIQVGQNMGKFNKKTGTNPSGLTDYKL